MSGTNLGATSAQSGAGGQVDLTRQSQGGGAWGGLQGVLDFLAGAGATNGQGGAGINATQYDNMMNGYGGYKYQGHMYKVPGSHGALSGLSPWAIQYIMKNAMAQDTVQQTPLTGLTGDALFQATLMNAAHNAAPHTYHLNAGMFDAKDGSGVSESAEQFLNSLFTGGALGSNPVYRQNKHGSYNETGYTKKNKKNH